MSSKYPWSGYLYILLTVLLTVYGQLIIKWRLAHLGALPDRPIDKVLFLVRAVFEPYIFSGFVAAFLASLTWMAAVTKFEISYAYPFMSLAFVLVLIFSVVFFKETLTLPKVVGLVLIVAGIVIASQR
jgi:multidrug transporter EmrE-like cation transporter